MVPLSDPVIFQRALVASELHSIFTARLSRSSRRYAAAFWTHRENEGTMLIGWSW